MQIGQFVEYIGGAMNGLKGRAGIVKGVDSKGWKYVDFGSGFGEVKCAEANLRRVDLSEVQMIVGIPPVQSPDAMALLRELAVSFEENHARWARGDGYDTEDRACSESIIERVKAFIKTTEG